MRLDRFDARVIQVTLSRRNLLGLLAKVDGHPVGSTGALLFEGKDGEPTLVVLADDDWVHYGKRGYPPGAMPPATEARIRTFDPGGIEARCGRRANDGPSGT